MNIVYDDGVSVFHIRFLVDGTGVSFISGSDAMFCQVVHQPFCVAFHKEGSQRFGVSLTHVSANYHWSGFSA